MTPSICHTLNTTQRDQLEQVLVSGVAIELAKDPNKAKSLAEGIKHFLDALHPQPVLYNPHTGAARDPRDVASDPQAILCVKPGEPLRAAAIAAPELSPSAQADQRIEAAKASGQYTAQLAAGALSALHVSANTTPSAQADQAAEAEIVAAGLTAPRVTADHIQALMDKLTWRYEHKAGSRHTFAHAFLGDFYIATGHNAPISRENFDAHLGIKYAKEQAEPKARDKLWELEGYALHSKLAGQRG